MLVRSATPADHAQMAALFEEMQAYYKVPCPLRSVIEAGLAARPPGAEILVVEKDSVLAGFAAFSAIYPGPGLAGGLFLKELFVSGPHRDSGVVRGLMRALARIAVQRGLKRIDWTADAASQRLLAFYGELGGSAKQDRVFFRLDGEALSDLAGD